MQTFCKVPVTHGTTRMRYYDIYLQLSSKRHCALRIFAYTNYRGEHNGVIDGVLLETVYPDGDGTLFAPYSGHLRFVIPKAGQVAENAGICLVIESKCSVQCVVQDILLNDVFGKPCFLHLTRGGTCQPFLLEKVSCVATTVLEDRGLAAFDVPATGPQDYLLLYQAFGKGETREENHCSLFLPKTNYCLDDPIVFSYRNVYFKFDVNTFSTDVLLYLNGDKPGIDPSKEYVTVMYQEKNRGLDGSFAFPIDGFRYYCNYIPGDYTLRLMQNYTSLCPSLHLTISKEHRVDELNAPPPGYLFFIKTSRLPAHLEIYTKHPERLSVLHFTTPSPMVDLMEQSLYSAPNVANIANLLGQAGELSMRLLQSVVYQILQTAYTIRIQELEEVASVRVERSVCNRVAAYVNNHLGHNLTIQMLADAFHISRSHLSHSFKRSMNISLSKYIYQTKINRAKQWLSENELTVTEVARLLGYSDIHTFSHSFKDLVGISPAEYRKLNRKKKNLDE